MQNNTKQEILEKIAQAKTIQIAGHTNPDGDAIGACLAFGLALEKAGKDVTVLLEHYAPKYDVIPGKHLVKEAVAKADLFLALDCGDEGRLGAAADWFQQADVTTTAAILITVSIIMWKVHLLPHLKSYTVFWKEITLWIRIWRQGFMLVLFMILAASVILPHPPTPCAWQGL